MAKDRVDRDEEDLVRLYLSDIGQYTLLTKDDEVRLAKAIEEGKSAEASLKKSEKQVTPTRRRELRRGNPPQDRLHPQCLRRALQGSAR